jgi:protein SCO1
VIGRTTLASAALASIAWLCASALTQGFQVWTAEGARRLDVAQAPVAAPEALLRGAGMTTDTSLHAALARPGRVTIASFIYTRCATVCLAMGSSFQQLQQVIAAPSSTAGAYEGIQLLSISFDPSHDDADQLSRYAALWRADERYWRMTTVPDTAQLQRLLKAWQVVVIDDGLGGYEHNAALLVIDEHGRLVRIFDESEGATALAFARMLQRSSRPGSLV